MRRKTCILCLFSFYIIIANAQQITVLTSRQSISIRGLSVVNDKVIWASGSNGTVARSIDSGKTWQWMQVPEFEKADFRDIEAFDAETAIIMAIAEPAYILKTHDGGNNWQKVFIDERKGMFLDAMEFWNERSGIVIGDPVNGKIFVARTFDGGDSWQALPENNLPVGETGEAMFASSGTNIRAISLSEAAFVTGGTKARFFLREKKIDLPLMQGMETTGANSLAVYNNKKRKPAKHMVAVGGDFRADTVAVHNCAVTEDGGLTWKNPQTPPHGYRSCVEYISDKKLITCGTSGVDISGDGGMNWQLISRESFHVCRKAKKGKNVFLAGKDGRIAKLVFDM
ncbi:MAG: oxidoreductase [Terrimonas sp.]|nr:oxidoreductase [Terrimonas sp.]OJY93162.1 MAG: oxidoreductase [Sphingobacteriales bacterium 40-81]